MIRTSRQLKALVRNLSKDDSARAQIIIRNYVMERFLERLSLSSYRNNLILKGGTLVAAMVGLDNRSRMDVDTTLKNLPLNEKNAKKIVEEITGIQIDDGMTFEIKSVAPIMDEVDNKNVTNGTPNATFTVGPFTSATTKYYIIEETTPGTGFTVNRQYLVCVTVSGTTTLTRAIDYKYREWNTATDAWGDWTPTEADSFTSYSLSSTVSNTPLQFTNTYPIKPSFHIRKTTAGSLIPSSWTVNFTLFDATYNTSTGAVTKGGAVDNKNVTNGTPNATFSVGPFTSATTKYYIIEETTPGTGFTVNRQYLVRVTMSGTTTLTQAIDYKYREWNTATDAWGDWTPTAADSFTSYSLSSTVSNTPLQFTNTYPIKPSFHIRKTTAGVNIPSSWTVNFTLFDATYNTSTGAVTKGNAVDNKNVTNGTPNATFSVGPFTSADTKYYIIEETEPGGDFMVNRQYLVCVTVSGTTTLTQAIDYKYREWNTATDAWGDWTPTEADSFTSYSLSSTVSNTPLQFTNTYPIKPSFHISKTATGAVPNNWTVNFSLFNATYSTSTTGGQTGGTATKGTLITSKDVDNNTPNATFSVGPFYSASTNYYIIEETTQDTGFTVDRQYLVRVTITGTTPLSSAIAYKYREWNASTSTWGVWTPTGTAVSSFADYNASSTVSDTPLKFTNKYNGPIFPEVGGIGRDIVLAIGTIIILSVSMSFGGTLIYRHRKRRRCLSLEE